MSTSLLTKARVRPSIDSEMQALADHLTMLYRNGETARLAGALEMLAFLNSAQFQQICLAAPQLQNALADYLPKR